MRKKIIAISLLFVLIMLVGCSNNKEKNVFQKEIKSKISESQKIITDDEIKKAYLKFESPQVSEQDLNFDGAEILEIYGQYGDAVVVLMNRPYFCIYIKNPTIFIDAGLTILFPNTNNGNYPLVYKNGNMYEMRDAYIKGIITKENILDLKSKLEK